MSSKTKNDYFVGRAGKVYGPFSPAHFEQLKASGDLANYRYWWDPNQEAWQPVEAPPPPPSSAKVETALEGMPVVCHDFGMTMVAGKLENVTDQGCHLISLDGRDLPCFGEKSRLMLNLADTESGRSLNVKAMLQKVWRQGQTWVYRLTWDHLPNWSKD